MSRASLSSGLTDDEGFLYRSQFTLRDRAGTAAVKLEMQAQLELAVKSGVEPTHYDSHMYAVLCSRFFPDYVDLGDREEVIAFIPRCPPRVWREDRDLAEMIAVCEGRGLPIFDHVLCMGLSDPGENSAERAISLLRGLPPGLTYFQIHPARDSATLRAIATDWRCRVADYRAFLSADVRRCLRDCGIQPLSFKAIREAAKQLRHRAARAMGEPSRA